MKFSTVALAAFVACATAQNTISSSFQVVATISSALASVRGSTSSTSASSTSSTSTSSDDNDNDSSSTTSSSNSVVTKTIFYQYPNTFHKPVSPTLLGSTVVTSTQGQTSSYTLPSGASTFDVTVSNVTTTYTSTNTFHHPVSPTFVITKTYETTMGLPTSTSSGAAAARFGAGEVGAFGAFALGAVALL